MTLLLTRSNDRRNFISFRSWRSRSPPPPCGPRPLEALTSSRSQSTRVGHTNSFRRRITRLERSRSSGSTSGSSDQRDGARESAHHTRARPQGSRDGLRRPTRSELPTTAAPRAGSSSGEPVLSCRGRLARRGPHLASRPHSAAPQAQRRTVRAVVDRPLGVRLGGAMRVHIVRIVRAQMAVPFSGRSGQLRVDSTTTGHRCWSTRGYHAWTKKITALAAGSKANANEQRRSSSAAWPSA